MSTLARISLALVVGVAGWSGAAEAASSCPETRAVLKATHNPESAFNPEGGVKRPDLVGKQFRVLRIVRRSDLKAAPDDTSREAGYEAVQISGAAGRFVLKRQYLPRSSPAEAVSSWPAGGAGAPALAGRGKPEVVAVGDAYVHMIEDGPLAGLILDVVGCRAPPPQRGKRDAPAT